LYVLGLGARRRSESVGAAHGRRSVESSRRARCRATARTSHMRRDVGRAPLAVATTLLLLLSWLRSMLRIGKTHILEVQVVGHVRSDFGVSEVVCCGRECQVVVM
jgi:hypothetical protein